VPTSSEIAKTLAAPRRAGGRRLLWAAALLALVGLGAWAWSQAAGTAAGPSYVTEPVTRGPLTVRVTATGTVQPTTQVEVSSELSGTIAAVEVDFNDGVEVGQVLARLDDAKLRAQLANAEASLAGAAGQVAQAEASAREAQANFEAQQRLDERGVTSHQAFIGYLASHERAQAELAIARANVMLAEANLELQNADLEKTVIRSPINGVVLDRAAEVGQIVASSLTAPRLFLLAEDLREMELRVDIDEADIGRVKVGNPASFTVDAYRGRAFPATITEVRYAPEETDGVVTYKAVLSVDNGEGLLRPGMTATADITVAHVEDALQVPNTALRFVPPQDPQASGEGMGGLVGLVLPRPPAERSADAPAGDGVWVLREGIASRVEVTPGETDGRRTAIEAGDLAEGDAVVIDQTAGG
jgi:HlyD family secretion protein